MCGGFLDGDTSFNGLLSLIIALFVIDFLVGGIGGLFNIGK